jgi:tellurite resistance protein TehA-like permease
MCPLIFGRNDRMDKKDIVMIILISVIVLALASLTIPVILKTPHAGVDQSPVQQQAQQNVQPGQQSPPPAGQGESQNLKTAISFINIGLIIPLFFIYAGLYREMRSSFTLGLLAVIFALGMYAVTSNPLLIGLLGGRPGDIGLFQIIPDLCTTVALLVLIRISLE